MNQKIPLFLFVRPGRLKTRVLRLCDGRIFRIKISFFSVFMNQSDFFIKPKGVKEYMVVLLNQIAGGLKR